MIHRERRRRAAPIAIADAQAETPAETPRRA